MSTTVKVFAKSEKWSMSKKSLMKMPIFGLRNNNLTYNS